MWIYETYLNCESFFHLIFHPQLKYMFHIFIFVYCSFTGISRTHNIGRALHWHRRGHGFDSRWSVNFFHSFFFSNCLSCVTCEGLSSVLIVAIIRRSFIPSSRIFWIIINAKVFTQGEPLSIAVSLGFLSISNIEEQNMVGNRFTVVSNGRHILTFY